MTQSEPAPYPHTLPKPSSNVCPHPCDDVASVTVLCRTTGGGGTPGGGSVPLASRYARSAADRSIISSSTRISLSIFAAPSSAAKCLKRISTSSFSSRRLSSPKRSSSPSSFGSSFASAFRVSSVSTVGADADAGSPPPITGTAAAPLDSRCATGGGGPPLAIELLLRCACGSTGAGPGPAPREICASKSANEPWPDEYCRALGGSRGGSRGGPGGGGAACIGGGGGAA